MERQYIYKSEHSIGFSLLEVVIAVAIAGVVGVLLVSLLVQNNGVYFNQTSKITQGINLNDGSSQIDNAIKSASSVAPNYPVLNPQYTSDANTLVLALPSIDSQSSVIDNTFDYIVISNDAQKPNILRKQVFPDPSSTRKSESLVLSTTLSQITFLYYDSTGQIVAPSSATKVSYSINLTEKASFGNQSSNLSGQVNLKNN